VLKMPTRHAQPEHPMEMMLLNIPALHREIIVATYFRQRTVREAALFLGLTPRVAQSRLYSAMRELSLMIAIDRPSRPAAVVSAHDGGWGVS
jgi:DNA-directed RNA polymerase specialized sigma24 family protein